MTADNRSRAQDMLAQARRSGGSVPRADEYLARIDAALQRLTAPVATPARSAAAPRISAPATTLAPQASPTAGSARAIARPSRDIAASPAAQHSPTDTRPLFVVAVSTWQRLEYLRRFVTSFDETRSRRFRWALIVADDGSTDGTLEYLDGLTLIDCLVVAIRNKRATIAGQTNAIFLAAQALSFDFGIKCDDDIYFSAHGWDDLYFDAAGATGRDHLVYHNAVWKPPVHDVLAEPLHSSVPALNALGCLWTFTPRVLNEVGYFDEVNFQFRGHAHLDYTVRCCRAGFNDEERLWDAAGSQDLVTMWGRDAYLETVDWRSPEVKAILSREERTRRMAVIADQDRGWAPPALGDPLRPRARVSVEPHDTATNLRLLDVPRFATTSGTADGVDAVFVLNLFADQRKWAEASSALARHGIVAQRWPGVNGNDAEHVDQWRDYASHGPVLPFEKQLNRRLIASPGAWGYLLSMRGLLQEAKNRRLNRIIVFDDDVLLHKDFGTLLSRAWNEIPPDWKLVYLGCTQKDWDRAVPVTDVVYQPGTAVNGSFAYMIDASVFDELLEGIDRFDWPFDSGPLCAVATRHPDQVYATRPHLAIADVRFSDIRAPRDLVRFAVEARWELGEYDVDLSHERGARPVSRALNAEDELLSVLIVVEDDEVGVAGALDSLRGQTEGRFEVVVLDNASVDRSLQVLRDRASKDTRVRLLRRDDRGTRVECLNLLVHEARGRHVLLHGSDEVSFPGRLAALRHAVESSSGVAGVRARALVVPRSPAQGTSDPHLLEAWGRQVANGTEHELLSAGLLSRLLLEEFGDLLLDGEDGVQELLRRAVLSRKAQKRDTIELAPTPEGVLSLVPVAPPAQDAEAREVARYHDELVAGLRPAHRTLLRPDVTLTAVLRPSRQEAPPDPSRATTKPSSASARV